MTSELTHTGKKALKLADSAGSAKSVQLDGKQRGAHTHVHARSPAHAHAQHHVHQSIPSASGYLEVLEGQPMKEHGRSHAMKKRMAGRQQRGTAKALGLCAAWMAIGPTLILLNKHILRDIPNNIGGKGFNYPMFLSGLGVLTTTVTAYLLVRVFKVVKLQQQHEITPEFYLRNMVPIGVCMATTLAFGNSIYLYLTVAFTQMLKAFTPVIVLLVGLASNVEKYDCRVMYSVLGICIGTAMASFGEVNFSMIGIFCSIMSALSEAFRLVLTQHLLKNLKFGIIEGHFWLGPPGVFCLFGASLVLEVPRMVRENAFPLLWRYPGLFLAAATLGLGVQLLTFMVVQVTGSVTLKVLGTARNALLVVLSVSMLGEMVTPLQLFGYTVAIVFFAVYSYFKSRGAGS